MIVRITSRPVLGDCWAGFKGWRGEWIFDASGKVPLMTDEPAEFDLSAIDFSAMADTTRNSPLARDVVGRVVSWYSQEILREERAAEPDQRRVEELESSLDQAEDDRRRIPHLDSGELEHLIDRYVALYRELRSQ